jgi:hypothetical protein
MLKHTIALLIFVSFSFAQLKDSLNFYERQFNPSIYDIKDLVFQNRFFGDEFNETTSGFRVQVLTTTKLDSANFVKNLLQMLLNSSSFQSQRVYIIYEPPNYKVRVGDFERLQDASLMRKFLVDNGFKYAWIVIDKIQKR